MQASKWKTCGSHWAVLTYEVKSNTSAKKTEKQRAAKKWVILWLWGPRYGIFKICQNANSPNKYLYTHFALDGICNSCKFLSWSVCNKIWISNFVAYSPTLEQCWLPQDINSYTSTLKVKPCATDLKYICQVFGF